MKSHGRQDEGGHGDAGERETGSWSTRQAGGGFGEDTPRRGSGIGMPTQASVNVDAHGIQQAVDEATIAECKDKLQKAINHKDISNLQAVIKETPPSLISSDADLARLVLYAEETLSRQVKMKDECMDNLRTAINSGEIRFLATMIKKTPTSLIDSHTDLKLSVREAKEKLHHEMKDNISKAIESEHIEDLDHSDKLMRDLFPDADIARRKTPTSLTDLDDTGLHALVKEARKLASDLRSHSHLLSDAIAKFERLGASSLKVLKEAVAATRNVQFKNLHGNELTSRIKQADGYIDRTLKDKLITALKEDRMNSLTEAHAEATRADLGQRQDKHLGELITQAKERIWVLRQLEESHKNELQRAVKERKLEQINKAAKGATRDLEDRALTELEPFIKTAHEVREQIKDLQTNLSQQTEHLNKADTLTCDSRLCQGEPTVDNASESLNTWITRAEEDGSPDLRDRLDRARDATKAHKERQDRWRWCKILCCGSICGCMFLLVVYFCLPTASSRAVPSALQEPLLAHVVLKDYGVLGYGAANTVVLHPPIQSTAIVDPIGLSVLRANDPGSSAGASGAIYRELGISQFPSEVINDLKHEGDAIIHDYPAKFFVIHVVSPDLRSSQNADWVLERLALSYSNVLDEFLKSDAQKLRLLPISGGMLAGTFLDMLPRMTFEALSSSLSRLGEGQRQELFAKTVEMCLNSHDEFAKFSAECVLCSGQNTSRAPPGPFLVPSTQPPQMAPTTSPGPYTHESLAPALQPPMHLLLELKAYGVLGIGEQGGPAQPPNEDIAIVDPAGLGIVQANRPTMAGGASGAIYRAIGLQSFPDEVVRGLRNTADAVIVLYPGKFYVVHVASPDLRQVVGRDDAIFTLTQAYHNVLSEFAGSQAQSLRMLPISGGIFSGEFYGDLPRMTFIALFKAFGLLGLTQQGQLQSKAVEMCIFVAADYQVYESALQSVEVG
mmetsp:Transcript_148631/g.477220  ORF Transcript_148631/g.477220 Transcript_148631/m.477220 type:complete len:957 (-) Transcript_148631:110-2980(-)